MSDASGLHDITDQNVQLVAELEAAAGAERTPAERTADFVAGWIGSWTFILAQTAFILGWIAANAVASQAWDAYPFSFLAFLVALPAAFATPIIIMSQNRQGKQIERRRQLDLQINLLAERENTRQLQLLRLLCEKAGIDVEDDEHRSLEEQVQPDAILQQIADRIERCDDASPSGAHPDQP